MKTKIRMVAAFLTLTTLFGLATTRASAVDLLERYPTSLTGGDAEPTHARPWEFTSRDIFLVSRFELKVGDRLQVEIGSADLGVGHCADGAVWAVVLPRNKADAQLDSPVTQKSESISLLWLRFHPKEINRLFPPETVFADGDTNLTQHMRDIADARFRSSWHAGRNAMIPEPKDLTVDLDTTAGLRRFFVVDTESGTAEYVAAFEGRAFHPAGSTRKSISLETAPPVVVKTIPVAGAVDVDPSLTELRVTYSKTMQDGSWSWSTWGGENYPKTTGRPHYLSDRQTCVLPVQLQPGKFYATWLNSDKFKNFKDTNGRPAVPYLLTFTTASSTGGALAPIPKVDDLPGKIIFQGRYRHRSRGRDIDTPSELWVKEAPDGSLNVLAHLPFTGSWALASGNPGNRLTGYQIWREPSGDQAGYRIALELGDGMARLTRHGVGEDCDGRELKVPEGASFDPNTRPDPYCAANILLRAFALHEGEEKEFHVYDWDNSGNGLVDYTIKVRHAGKERVEVPAGAFEANHLVLTQVSSANTWFKKRAGHVTDFWVLDNHVIVRVLRHREPYEMLLLEYTGPEKPLTTGAASSHAAGRDTEVKSWVEDFFAHNFRDVTSRDTLEWGDVETNASGNLSIRYKYRARIWDRETITNNQVFTFGPRGRFVSVTGVYASPKERMMALVEKFFANNYRDITSRETIEWGEVETNANGNASIRYRYRARIRDRTTVTNDQVFTFDPLDKFVSVTDASPASPGADAAPPLNQDQQVIIAWTDRQFRSFFDERTFAGWSDEQHINLEKRSVDALNGPRTREYYQAINTLGALRSTNALPRLRELAFERVDKNNRDRWMAVRVLGLLGDRQSIPDLIHLVYHGNQNTHWWAQIVLVELTGQNFGGDWEAWGKWWNGSGGQPPYDPEVIRWWAGQADTVEELKQTLAEGDRRFLEDVRPTISRPGPR